MPTRRDFIKQSMGAVSVSLILPKSLVGAGRPASIPPGPGKKVLVVINCSGGNDGLNTVIPVTDTNYQTLRPTLGFKQSQLVDQAGRSTVISDNVGLHPSLTKFKDLYDQGRVAIIREVGYPNQSDSHFTSTDIWGTANPNGGGGRGWLGKYIDLTLANDTGLTAVTLTPILPKALTTDTAVVTALSPSAIADFALKSDPLYPADLAKDVDLLNANNAKAFPDGSLLAPICRNGLGALQDADKIRQAMSGSHPAVTYPASPLGAALQLVAALIAGIQEATILYVAIGSFDTHAAQAATHATLLTQFSEAVSAFYGDLSAQGLADDILMLEISEFGRRPLQNGSGGTDHGGAAPIFVFGNPVKGGIYGDPPDLGASALDATGNNRFKIDFRSVYATILKNWLSVDPRAILGGDFEDLGFLG